MADIKRKAAAAVTIATSGLNSLANDGRVLSDEYDNTSGLYTEAEFELSAGFGSAPTAGAAINLFLIPAIDGTNYAAGDGTDAAQGTTFIGSVSVYNSTSAKRLVVGGIRIPPLKFKILVENKAGQAFASSTNTLKMVPSQYQVA